MGVERRGSVGALGDDAEVASAAELGWGAPRHAADWRFVGGASGWPGGFADGFGQSHEIVRGRRGRGKLALVPYQLPAARSGQP